MQITEMTEEYAIEISRWKYDGDYQIYNMPSWEEMIQGGYALTDAGKRKNEFHAFVSKDKILLAFTRCTPQEDGIMLGVGVNPDYLSAGYGSKAIKLSVEHLLTIYPTKEIFLEVRTWNTRAVNSYKKAGFTTYKTIERETRIGRGQFFRMVYIRGQQHGIY